MADGTDPLFVSQLCRAKSSFGTEYGVRVYRATTTHTHTYSVLQEEKPNIHAELSLETDPGWIHDNLVGFTHPSIHPSIHSASMISTPSHLIPFHPSIHPFIQPSPSCLECAGWIMLIGFPDHSVLYYYYPAHSKGPITTTTFVPSSPNSLAPVSCARGGRACSSVLRSPHAVQLDGTPLSSVFCFVLLGDFPFARMNLE